MRLATTNSFLVLSQLKYKDHFLIIRGLTDTNGIKSFIINRKHKTYTKYLQPLNYVELTYYDKEEGLGQLIQVDVLYHYQKEGDTFIKNGIFMFVNELLYKLLKDDIQFDSSTFDFIIEALQFLDQTTNKKFVADFVIWFLYQLTAYLGITPNQSSYSEQTPYFNLKTGCFQKQYDDLMVLNKRTSYFMYLIGVADTNIAHLPEWLYEDRQQLTEALINYYYYHQDVQQELKSYSIIKTLFI